MTFLSVNACPYLGKASVSDKDDTVSAVSAVSPCVPSVGDKLIGNALERCTPADLTARGVPYGLLNDAGELYRVVLPFKSERGEAGGRFLFGAQLRALGADEISKIEYRFKEPWNA